MDFFKKLKTKTPKIRFRLSKILLFTNVVNVLLVIATAGYVYVSFRSLPEVIPFFYTISWGPTQLAPKAYIWGLSAITLIAAGINFSLAVREFTNNHFNLAKFYTYTSTIITLLFCYYTFRIVSISSFEPIIVPSWARIIVAPFVISAAITSLISPFVIKTAYRMGFMDDPLTHKHPGMLLKRPTPRAGGLAYYLGILIPALIILPVLTSQKLIGILVGAGLCVLMGLKDDRKDMSPYTRLIGQAIVILITVLSGIILIYIPNPFGQAINLDYYKWTFDLLGETRNVFYWSVLAAAVWIGITMNFMSFANGSDGVYAGLVTIASLVIAILMLPSIPMDPDIANFVKLAALSAGAGLGMAIFTWPPQKFLWGFGATSAGLIIATLSIIGSTKIAVTLIVLIIPFMDGAFAVIRRLRRGQLPFWGDREHLHHKLLEGLGWSKQRVAIFYWSTTIIFGALAIISSGQSRALSLASIAIIIILGITMLNFVKRPTQR